MSQPGTPTSRLSAASVVSDGEGLPGAMGFSPQYRRTPSNERSRPTTPASEASSPGSDGQFFQNPSAPAQNIASGGGIAAASYGYGGQQQMQPQPHTVQPAPATNQFAGYGGYGGQVQQSAPTQAQPDQWGNRVGGSARQPAQQREELRQQPVQPSDPIVHDGDTAVTTKRGCCVML